MAEVTIKKKEQIEVLKATIGDETYSIPLASSVPYLVLKNMRTEEKVIEFFKEYIPEDVFNGLLAGEIMQLVKAWNDATQAATGASVGES